MKLPLLQGSPRGRTIGIAAWEPGRNLESPGMFATSPVSHRFNGLLAFTVVAVLLAPTVARADCNSDLGDLAAKRAVVNAALEKNKKAHGGKIDPVEACPQLKALAAAQGNVAAYMQKNKDWCSLPDDLVTKVAQSQAQISSFAVKACGMIAKMKEMQAKAAQQQASQVPTLKLPAGPL